MIYVISELIITTKNTVIKFAIYRQQHYMCKGWTSLCKVGTI